MATQRQKPYRDTIKAALAAYDAGDVSVLARETIAELARIAFSRLDELGTWTADGFVLTDSAALTPDQVAAVGEISSRETKHGKPIITVKLWPKLRALELLLQVCGKLVQKHEVSQVSEVVLDWGQGELDVEVSDAH